MINTTTRIVALKRLLSATSEFGRSTHVIEQEVVRTQGRLSSGIDVDGNSFAPYKDPARKHPHSRPLEHAAKLFESPSYDMTRTLDGAEFKASIHGNAAKIAHYQNIKRKFIGFSRQDREAVKEELMAMIAKAYNSWHYTKSHNV